LPFSAVKLLDGALELGLIFGAIGITANFHCRLIGANALISWCCSKVRYPWVWVSIQFFQSQLKENEGPILLQYGMGGVVV
jgi:hypothetical protein